MNQKNKEYICIQDPIINELHNTYKGKEIKKKKIQLIDIILEHFKTHDGILTKIDYIKLSKENNFKTKWGSLLFISLQEPSETNKRPWKWKQQEKYGSIIKKSYLDGKKYDSPNSGISEAIFAYISAIKLGGKSKYKNFNQEKTNNFFCRILYWRYGFKRYNCYQWII